MTDTVTPRASTGRLTVNPGDTIASVWGNTTFDQTAQVYDSTADRDAQWPTPKDGAMCYTLDTQTAWMRRSGAWVGFASPPRPPVAAGAALAAYTDPSGDVWIAKGGVNGGAWKRARDVVHAEAYRSAPWTVAAAGTDTFIPLDTVAGDPYGLVTLGTTAVFTCPVAGVYLAEGASQANPNIVTLMRVFKAGTVWRQQTYNIAAAIAMINGSARCAAGDTLAIAVRVNTASSAMSVGQLSAYTAFHYLGTG